MFSCRLLATAFKDGKGEPNIKFLHGTTTLGFVFQGGVIIAVDSRASMGGYVASQTVQKCIPITPCVPSPAPNARLSS
jgi:20S proteasome alpha/beta subunit